MLFFDISDKIKKPSLTENDLNIQDKKNWKKILGNSFAFGDGLKKALCGIPSSFNVMFALGTGEQISTKIFKKNNMLTVTMEPLYIEVQVNIDKKTDTLVVSYTLPKLRAGRYLINVTFLGEHMRGSPFNLIAKNGKKKKLIFIFKFQINFLSLIVGENVVDTFKQLCSIEDWKYSTVLAIKYFTQQEDHDLIFNLGIDFFLELAKHNSPYIKRDLGYIFLFLITQDKKINQLMGQNALKFVADLINTNVWNHLRKLHEHLCKFIINVMMRQPHLSKEFLQYIEEPKFLCSIPKTNNQAWLELYAKALSFLSQCETKDNKKIFEILYSLIQMLDKTSSEQIKASIIRFISNWDSKNSFGIIAIPEDAAVKFIFNACKSHDHISKYHALVCIANLAQNREWLALLHKKGFDVYDLVISLINLSEVTTRWEVSLVKKLFFFNIKFFFFFIF
jgi:hypothetical protein